MIIYHLMIANTVGANTGVVLAAGVVVRNLLNRWNCSLWPEVINFDSTRGQLFLVPHLPLCYF